MPVQHKHLAAGRWFELTLAEQLGNIGSEVHRAAASRGKSEDDFRVAFQRALELIDLTLADPRWRGRLKEIARLRELLGDAASGGVTYLTTLEDLDRYLMHFAIAARLRR